MLAHVRELIEPDGVAYVSTPNVLTLAPEGRGALRQPVARPRVQAGGVPRAVRAPLRRRRAARPVPRAQAARAPGRDRAPGLGPRAPGAAPHAAVLRALQPRDQRARLHAAPRRPRAQPGPAGGAAAMKRSASSCTPTCPTSRASARGRSARSGCGRRSRPATCRCWTCSTATPGKVTLSHHARARRPARGAGRAGALPDLPARGPARLARARPAPTHPQLALLRGAATQQAADALERRGDLIAAFAPARHAGPPRPPTPSCRCWPRTPACGCSWRPGSRRTARRFGAWHGGFWLPECAHAPWLDDLLEEAGVHVTCVDWTNVGSHASRAAPRPGIVLVPLDRAGDRPRLGPERLPGARRLPRHEPAHAARAPGVGRRRRAVRPRARPRARARARASLCE